MSTLYPNSGSVLVSNNSLVFSSVVIPPNTLKIFDVVTIHSDGRVDVDPKYTTDEAAKLFWKAIRDMAPSFFKKDN